MMPWGCRPFPCVKLQGPVSEGGVVLGVFGIAFIDAHKKAPYFRGCDYLLVVVMGSRWQGLQILPSPDRFSPDRSNGYIAPSSQGTCGLLAAALG